MRNDTRLLPAGVVLAGPALALALVFALAGCQTVPVSPAPSVSWSVRRPELQALGRFGLNGRVAVAVGNQGFNAGLRWMQSAAVTQLALTGPLGAGGVEVTANGDDLSVVTSNGKRLGNAAARTQLEDKLGFEPPLASLRYWVLGVPDPATPASVQLDSQQRVTQLTQDGWQIDYTAYMPVGADWLPRLLTLRRQDVRVRMVVDGWQL
ncbi:MAG TPA: lipoprotein insertase outer membrane protein LolB [Steroidobacteraceae bacterium]|nr:lipoprotein insertase outer membrane protein LolB [Steroidobacteraceae bacterium]